MAILAHIRDGHRLSLGSYGMPRMTEKLNELGLRVGQRRVGRLMRQNDIRLIRSRKFKRTTDSDHVFNIAPNLPWVCGWPAAPRTWLVLLALMYSASSPAM